jgi:hypothetical protein
MPAWIRNFSVIEGGPADPFRLQETDRPNVADLHAYFKVELWTKDGRRIQRMLWAGNRIEKARTVFAEALRRRPRGRYTTGKVAR